LDTGTPDNSKTSNRLASARYPKPIVGAGVQISKAENRDLMAENIIKENASITESEKAMSPGFNKRFTNDEEPF